MSNKNVKNIVLARVGNLLELKDLSTWSEKLNSFFTAYRVHPALLPAFEAIHKQKLKEYEVFFQAYKDFADEVSQLLLNLEHGLQGTDNLPVFPRMLINEELLSFDNPFSQPEGQFFEVCKTLRHFFEGLVEHISKCNRTNSLKYISLLTGYFDISTRILYRHSVVEESLEKEIPKSFLYRKSLNVDGKTECHIFEAILNLEFKSPIFHRVFTEAEALARSKDASLWKKLDNLDKWVIWTERGIHPENLSNKHNLFKFLKIEEAINSLSEYLVDYLVKDEELPESVSQESASSRKYSLIHSMSIFPYRASSAENYTFWMVLSYPNGTSNPYYVREVVSGSEAYKFVEALLQLQRGNIVDFEDASTSRAELSITKEIAKIFFGKSGRKRVVFRGFTVFLNELEENIDLQKLQNQLEGLNRQQNIPQFPQSTFQAFFAEHALRNEIPTYSDVES